MKILCFIFHFPPMSGGGAVVAADIVNAMATLGNDVTVLVPDIKWEESNYNPKFASNVKIHRVPSPFSSKIKIAARMCKENLENVGIKLGKENNYDFIFTIFHPFHFVPNAAVACGKKLKIPVVTKIDDAIFPKSTGIKSIQRKIEKKINSKTLNDSYLILAVNEKVKKVVHEYYDITSNKIIVIPHGIEIKKFKSKNENKEDKVVFSGVMYDHRGVDILLEAVPNVISRHPSAKFILLGEGPEMQKLKQITKEKNIEDFVEFKGWVERDQIPYYLKNSSIAIGPLKLTSVTASALPVKVLEYMAASLPIIAKKGTLPSEVLMDSKNGYLIENSNDLADKIVSILKDQKLATKMGEESLSMVLKFSWPNIIKNIFENLKKSK